MTYRHFHRLTLRLIYASPLKFIVFPVTSTIIDTWDADVVAPDEVQLESISRSMVNVAIVFYGSNGIGVKSTRPTISADGTSIVEHGPGSNEDIADYVINSDWIGTEDEWHGKTIASRVGDRLVKMLKNGLISIRFSTFISKYKAQVGDRINLVTPTFLKRGIIGTNKTNLTSFVLIEKKPDIQNGKISWVAVEDVQINTPPTAKFTADITSGLPDLTVTVDVTPSVSEGSATITLYEVDFDYDGFNFTVDASRTTPGTLQNTYLSSSVGFKKIALRVTDSNGLQHISTKLDGTTDEAIIRVLAIPTARINSSVSAPDQPLQVFLTSASVGRTAVIVKTEWDLSYDGVAFNPEVVGEETSILLPYKTITVALRVTDDDGLTSLVQETFTGKTLAPAPVTGFFVSQSGDKIVFNWEVVGDPDRDSYEIRKGASWNSSVLIASQILTTSFMTVAPLKAGSHTYLIKAINTTGRYSINETAITITIIDPRNRNIIDTTDIKAAGWPGTKTGLVYEVANDRWWIESASGNVTQGDTTLSQGDTRATVLAGTRVSGSFETNAINLGSKIDGIRLSIDTDTDIEPDPVGTSLVTEYSESDDNLSYTPFAQLSQGDLGYQYVKLRITLKNDDNASNVALKALVINNDVPDVFDSQSGISVGSTGTTPVVFKRQFNSTASIPLPTVNPIIQNMTHGQYAQMTNLTVTGFDVAIYNMQTDAQEAGVFGYQAKGF